ncbi:MAG: hypothetical protein J0647_05555 [Campylobacteraceae bacterium]|nr:hypothetical protein [Campylobacteraceae bacterium]
MKNLVLVILMGSICFAQEMQVFTNKYYGHSIVKCTDVARNLLWRA